MITIRIKTWKCPKCGYCQDFSPLNPEKMKKVFRGVPLGLCPNCYKNKERVTMVREEDEKKKIQFRVLEDIDIDNDLVVKEDRRKPKNKKTGLYPMKKLTSYEKKEAKKEAKKKLDIAKELECDL